MGKLADICDNPGGWGPSSTFVETNENPSWDWRGKEHGSPWDGTSWMVTLKFKGRVMEVPFFCGFAVGEPDTSGVLSCLLQDGGGVEFDSFEGWCDDYGYDTDSRKALALYEACEKIASDLHVLLGEEYDYIAQLERD